MLSHVHCMCAGSSNSTGAGPAGASPARPEAQDRTEEEEQKPDANYLVGERPTGWHSRCADSLVERAACHVAASDPRLSCTNTTTCC